MLLKLEKHKEPCCKMQTIREKMVRAQLQIGVWSLTYTASSSLNRSQLLTKKLDTLRFEEEDAVCRITSMHLANSGSDFIIFGNYYNSNHLTFDHNLCAFGLPQLSGR